MKIAKVLSSGLAGVVDGEGWETRTRCSPRYPPLRLEAARLSTLSGNDLGVLVVGDTNRDGRVDEADLPGKETWTRQSGALFLAGITDTSRRCYQQINEAKPDHGFDLCHRASLREGVELGIEARDVRRPGGWHGRVALEIIVQDEGRTIRDAVELRVAPVLLHHHGQAAEQLFTKSEDMEVFLG
ncbi:hypothetical protein HIM_08506 [Hirsutella minnesotensis 3608]|uniref:Uncharacterized protein n=1 Tax=Hirsutella minnesotensis 3608 TaxID=1043627 RepID=A0A0F7ZSX7_9HYPO|nr:hypothetical protein HIM_08506 [Hirsutella minnesotensis 3608]